MHYLLFYRHDDEPTVSRYADADKLTETVDELIESGLSYSTDTTIVTGLPREFPSNTFVAIRCDALEPVPVDIKHQLTVSGGSEAGRTVEDEPNPNARFVGPM